MWVVDLSLYIADNCSADNEFLWQRRGPENILGSQVLVGIEHKDMT
jgi:hypothetical protein